MVKIFNYKQKIFSKIVLLVILLVFPFATNKLNIFTSFFYYFIFFILEALNYVYYATKQLIITDEGIEEKLFKRMSWESAKWDEMEEAYVIMGSSKQTNSSFHNTIEPSAVKKWLEDVNIGTIKVIITNRDAMIIKLQDIKNSSELSEILNEKIRFIKN